MKGSLLNTILCFIGFSNPGSCIDSDNSNWKNSKFIHFESTQNLLQNRNSHDILHYYASDLLNDSNFESNLDKILIPRTVGSENHGIVRQHIVSTLRDLDWSVEEHGFNDNTPHGNLRFTNIIATLNPNAPRRLVLACHYDSLNKPPGFLGAIDSAVPCAQMINLAHTMNQDLKMQKAKNLDLTLQLIFFDGEEAFVSWSSKDSIWGARALAAKWQSEVYSRDGVSGDHNDRIDVFVLLDLIGTSDTQFSQLESTTENWYNRMVSIESDLRNQNLVSGPTIFNQGLLNVGIEDDHIPFKNRNVPILHLISVPFPSVWHKIEDNKASLDLNRISHISKILRVFVAEYLNITP